MTCCGAAQQRSSNGEIVYRPDYRHKAVTEKFYSKYDRLDMIDLKKFKNLQKFAAAIEKRLRYDPRKYFLTPLTENQVYGWMEHLGPRYDAHDKQILLHPRRNDETTATMMKILYDMRRERMYGLR